MSYSICKAVRCRYLSESQGCEAYHHPGTGCPMGKLGREENYQIVADGDIDEMMSIYDCVYEGLVLGGIEYMQRPTNTTDRS